jgi:hypothetical protein
LQVGLGSEASLIGYAAFNNVCKQKNKGIDGIFADFIIRSVAEPLSDRGNNG